MIQIQDTECTGGDGRLKHQMVYDRLIQVITDDNCRVGQRLPSERELSERLDVNIATVRRAFRTLTNSGIVEKRIGSGTYLKQPLNDDWTNRPFNFLCNSTDGNMTFRRTLKYLPQVAAGRGRQVRVVYSSTETTVEMLESFVKHRQPTIILGYCPPEYIEVMQRAPELFVVLANRLDHLGIASVLCDDHKGIQLLVEHLQRAGHRRIALFRSSSQQSIEDVQCAVWRNALGDDYDPELSIWAHLKDGDDPMDKAFLAMQEAARRTGFSALLCLNDEIMLAGISALNQLGRRVPEDISVVSIGNTNLSRYAVPPVTCYDPNLEKHLQHAFDMLDNNHSHPEIFEKLRLVDPIFIERASVIEFNPKT